MKLLAKGAEAELYLIDWFGRKAVLKRRVSKRYRHPLLDRMLRLRRTINEARMLLRALELGLPVPTVYEVRVSEAEIIMEYVEGINLRWYIEWNGLDERASSIVRKVGYYIGVLHENNIAHGDVTTSNVIVSSGGFKLIDFGLAEHTSSEEDKAVDVHLFLRACESTHPEWVEKLFKLFMEGYSLARGNEKTDEILGFVKKIRLMGRYVEERRRRKMTWEIQR